MPSRPYRRMRKPAFGTADRREVLPRAAKESTSTQRAIARTTDLSVR